MNADNVRRFTGVSGVAVGVASILVIPLYFSYAGPPPVWQVLTRNLLGIAGSVFMLVFVAGFSHIVRRTNVEFEWLMSVFYGTGITFVVLTLVAIAHEVGAIFEAPPGTVDPTIHGPLALGNVLIHGSIKRALTVALLACAGHAIIRTGALPAWLGRTAYAVAVINLAFVPSLYFGTNAAVFYSALGWGNTALVASLLAYWIFAAGIVLLRRHAVAIAV